MKQIFSTLALVVLTTIMMVNLSIAGTKSTATVSAVDKVITVTLPAPYNETVYAGTFAASVDGKATSLYCIDISNPLEFNSAYTDVASTNDTLAYILNNYYPYKTGYTGMLSPEANEAGAVQMALWHFSDGLDINNVTGDATVKARALAIVADALANVHTFSLNTFTISFPDQTYNVGDVISFTVKAFNETGLAMSGVSITLSTTAGTLSTTTTTTGANGVSPVITLTPAAGTTTATITANGIVGIPSGTKYYNSANPNTKQKLILAKPTTASRTITQVVNWTAPLVLNVQKTADKATCKNGDVINYTIKAINSGLSNATNVKVSDQLSAALQYVSSSPAGVYNPTTGIWSVGTLNAGATSTLTIQVKVNLGADLSLLNLGIAKDYNVFVLDTIQSSHCDIQGKLAAGKYAELSGYSVGDQLPAGSGNVAVVGEHLSFLVGRVYNGKAVYGKYITSTTGFSADDGIVQDSTVIDFGAAKTTLCNLSNQLSLLTTNGTQTLQYNHLALTGTNSSLNVFHINGADLSTINDFSIDVPAGSSVVVNVDGSDMNWHGGFEVNGTTKDKVLLNFYNATNITVSGIEIRASILAPYATFNFPVGLMTGQLICKTMLGSGQFNLCPFTGSGLLDTTIANVALLVSAEKSSMKVATKSITSYALLATDKISAVKSESSTLPTQFKMEQNYPNPFNPSTTINYSVAKREMVNISVYAIDGRLVATLVNGELEAGNYSVSFNASHLNSGVYFYRFASNSMNSVKKMILMK
jgi:choice-of-anchor A domain-containing protein/uncharacterized repeat protein (TIGR01451 family)